MRQVYVSHYEQLAGQQIRAEQITDRADRGVVMKALIGPNGVKDLRQIMSDPGLLDAYNRVLQKDPGFAGTVSKAINANAWAAWDPPALAETDKLYSQLYGMSATDRDNFSKLNLMQYYGGMPVSQFNELKNVQQKIQDKDAAEAARQTNMNASLTAISDVTGLAALSPESPYYKMDYASSLLPEQQKWNEFIGRFGQAMEDWRQNNGGKIPSVMQEREIAQQILFPQGALAQGPPTYAGAAHVSGSPEAGSIINPPSQDTNTSKDANADTNVLDSSGKPDQMVSEEGVGNKGEAASDVSLEGHETQAPRVDIYVYPRNDKGYDFVAINSSNPKVIQGQFNVTTTNDTSKVRPGDYTISYRPHIEVKSGIAGIKQTIGAMWSGNLSGNVNKHEGYPTLSNTNDWDTIKYEDGTQLGGVMIHPGRNEITGEGGVTEGCFVTNRPTYEQLHQILLENDKSNGQAYFHLQPR
jgi:hypothetical protein